MLAKMYIYIYIYIQTGSLKTVLYRAGVYNLGYKPSNLWL